MSATYLLLEDHYLSNQLVLAGTTITEGDGICPIGWVPSPNVDPLNTAAVNAFYAAGPQVAGSIRQQWVNQTVSKPVTYWQRVGAGFSTGFSSGFLPYQTVTWQLTGLGANLAAYPPIGAL